MNVVNGFFEEEEEKNLSPFLFNAPPRNVAISTRFGPFDFQPREYLARRRSRRSTREDFAPTHRLIYQL